MHDFKKLRVWDLAMELTKKIYLNTKAFPREEMFGLTQQIRRSAISIPSNIAEGSGRSSNRDFKSFLHYAYGSSCELETQLLLAEQLRYLNESASKELLIQNDEIQKILFSLIEKFK